MQVKDDEVVEFALSRSLSPTMVSEYNLKLIDKKLLQRKLKEYITLVETTSNAELEKRFYLIFKGLPALVQ